MTSAGPGGSFPARPIAPTIVVGLGGLGREVVFRTRRRLYERYRRTTVPVVSFLWLDHNTEVDPTPELPARVARKVALPAEDRISLGLAEGRLEELLKDPSTLPDGGTWFPADAVERSRDAVRSRLLGRLAFHLREDDVIARVREIAAAIDTTAAHEEAQDEGFPTERRPDGPEFVLVTSLAGGLGSGSLLPLARALRGAFPKAHIRGVLFLSGLFMAHDMNRRQLAMANGWAAASELQAAQKTLEPGTVAPFDALYLVDRENADGNRPIDPLEPLEMVAESLTLELSRSKTSGAVRGIRYLAETGPDFASFGLASMAPGGGRLRSAVAYLLGAELLDRWANGAEPDAAAKAGLAGGWPEAALAGAARDLREEFETYDIPPVEERNQPLPAPTDLRPLLMTHLREEFGLPADADDAAALAETSRRFVASLSQKPPAASLPGDSEEAWERFMDRLERFSLQICHQFDRRMANSDPVLAEGERADAVARLRSWSEPWTPLRESDSSLEKFATVVGSGIPAEAPLVQALGDQCDVLPYHPGTILRYRETPGLAATNFTTLHACRSAYAEYTKAAGPAKVHRHTVANPDALPDPLV